MSVDVCDQKEKQQKSEREGKRHKEPEKKERGRENAIQRVRERVCSGVKLSFDHIL